MTLTIDDVLRDGSLGYDGRDNPERRAAAVEAAAELDASGDLHLAAMLGRSRDVERLLADDPARASTRGGPRDWPPLLYLAYGRVDGRREGESWLAAAEALLDAGADPNAHWLWDGTYRFTALTGCFGEGEGGPRALPEHPEALALARLLLDRGADPNDGQALYNRMFTSGCACLELLIEAGLKPTDRVNWPAKDPSERTTMSYQLFAAARDGHLDRIELLLAAGVKLDERDEGGRDAAYAARLGGHLHAAERLETAGLNAAALDDIDRFTSSLRGGDIEGARALATPERIELAIERHGDLYGDCIAHGSLEGARLLVEGGVDIAGTGHTPAAHQAAHHGRLEVLRWLLAEGVDPARRDDRFSATALGWARHAGQDEAAAALSFLDE